METKILSFDMSTKRYFFFKVQFLHWMNVKNESAFHSTSLSDFLFRQQAVSGHSLISRLQLLSAFKSPELGRIIWSQSSGTEGPFLIVLSEDHLNHINDKQNHDKNTYLNITFNTLCFGLSIMIPHYCSLGHISSPHALMQSRLPHNVFVSKTISVTASERTLASCRRC